MAIKVRNIKVDSDIIKYNVSIELSAGSAGQVTAFAVPYKCVLRQYGFGMTAAGKSAVCTISNLTTSQTLVNAASLAAPAAKGSVVANSIQSDAVISAGSLLQFAISSTALAKGYAFVSFQKIGE